LVGAGVCTDGLTTAGGAVGAGVAFAVFFLPHADNAKTSSAASSK
jgi:hypothetical protein